MAHLNIANGEDNAIAATQQALKNIGNNLEAIEIGNEGIARSQQSSSKH